MVTNENVEQLRIELSIKSKNGVDFTLASAVIWIFIAYAWTTKNSDYDKSVLTFILSSLMLPLAFLFSKLFKSTWKNKSNPLQPLGLWLNFAQLFYFPFLIFTLIKMPVYFVMVYAIITGGHLFPFAWFYKTIYYAIFSAIISIGAMILGLILSTSRMFLIPCFLSITLIILSIFLYFDSKSNLAMNNVE